ncbi:MAG TPA: hypothetical protein VFL91_21390 [Thermomicrobiales bacterium]|nr:hypothetical protein [Thermomicrobiales bacterium]
MQPKNATVSTAWRVDPLLRALPDGEQVVWWRLGLYLVERGGDGHLLPDRILAIEVAGGDADLLERALGNMAGLGLVREHPDGGYVMDPFGVRAGARPSDSPERVRERVRRHRERKRAAAHGSLAGGNGVPRSR